jgi:CelD/BcsL family acetyltransferase involved in cellulose biosynthesis
MRWRIDPIAKLLPVAATWDALNAEAGDLPFLRADFLLPALAEFATGTEVLATLEDAGAALAMGIFRRARRGFWETFQPSQLPLGAFITKHGVSLDAAMPALARALPGVAVGVALTQQDPAIIPRPAPSPTLETLDYVDTACLRVSGAFDEYWALRGKNLRQNIKKQLAKLTQDGVVPRLDLIERPSEVADAIVQYGNLESAGWKAGYGTAINADNAQGRFYRSVFEKFCDTGSARIYRYSLGGRVVAMDLCLFGGGALVILKTTYDESLKSISPAFLMRHAYLPAVFAEKRCDRIEFYGKVMEWHLRWTDEVRTLFHVNSFRWPWVKSLRRRFGTLREKQLPAPPGEIVLPPEKTGGDTA